MSGSRTAGPEVRERDERDARFFAWDVPGDANIVALVHEPEEAERSATVVDAIATSVARRREHTLLLSAEPGPSPLDELLGGTESEGLPAALGGRARLIDVAVQRVDRPFVYLPAGRDPEALRKLLDDDLLATFVGRVRERGGTLFMVVSEKTLGCERLTALIDGYVALGDVSLPAAAKGLTAYGRVRFEPVDGPPGRDLVIEDPDLAPDGTGPAVDDAERAFDDAMASVSVERTLAVGNGAPGDAETVDGASGDPDPADPDPDAELWALETDPDLAGAEPAPEPFAIEVSPAWERHRQSNAFPVLPVAGGVVAVLAIALGWWWFARGTARADGVEPATLASAEAPAPEGSVPPPGAFDPDAARASFEGTPALALSVLVASYADEADARDRLGRLRAASAGALFFTAPTPVRGIVYHRVFAGALAGRGPAEALMRSLVDRGQKDEAGAWDVRPARFAFDLGLYGSRSEATGRVEMLGERGIPAYVIAAPAAEDSVYQVYGGAYESERASLPMAERLDAAGEAASLIPRHGSPHPSPSS